MKLNRDLIYFTIIVALAAASAQLYYSFNLKPVWQEQQQRKITVYYNREIAGNELIIEQINQAQVFVYFAIYTFTRQDIKDALLGAKFRGLEVRGVMDKKQVTELEAQTAIYKELIAAGIPIGLNNHSAIMHLKTLVTEQSYVSGSFNWTASANDRNDEIIEVGRDEDLRRKHQRVLQTLLNKYPPNQP